ncbi:MAG: CvpA family protein [Kiloniellales bacterium]
MDSAPINVTDLAVIAVVVVSGIFAFVRGFVHELLAIGAWIGAAIVTVLALPHLLPYARQIIAVQLAADIGAGVALFLFVLIALSILTHWLARRVRESSLGALDRSLGLVFGLLRGAVIVCLAWIALLWAIPRQDHPDWITEARTRPLVEQGAEALIGLLPEGTLPAFATKSQDGLSQPFDELVRPGVAPALDRAKEALPAGRSGYNEQDRKDMQRLFDASQ